MRDPSASKSTRKRKNEREGRKRKMRMRKISGEIKKDLVKVRDREGKIENEKEHRERMIKQEEKLKLRKC